MNANELADWIKDTEFYENLDPHINNTMDEVEAMLRQQQQRLTKYELRHVVQRDRIAILEAQHKQQQAEIESYKNPIMQSIALAFEPAKTLTDEEIEEIAKQYKDVDYTLDDEEPFDVFDYSGFARAILKKANEK